MIFKYSATTLLLALCLLSSCGGGKATDRYHPLANAAWERFDILKFDLPVEGSGDSWDVEMYAYLDNRFSNKSLLFNMVMNTPSGEERIAEYELQTEDTSNVNNTIGTGDSVRVRIILKRGMRVTTKGLLRVELENLVPRMKTEGIRGVGVKLIRSRD